MKRIAIISAFAIAVLYTAASYGQHATLIEESMILSPEKGGLELTINYTTERLLISDSYYNNWKFIWPDGRDMKYNKNNAGKRDFNKFLRISEGQTYVWIILQAATRGDTRWYKYTL